MRTVDKTRESYLIEEFEIELDRVSELGTFVEVEAVGEVENRGRTYEKVIRFVREIGLDPENQDNNGYVLLLMKKKGFV